jgi:hypothetical protein
MTFIHRPRARATGQQVGTAPFSIPAGASILAVVTVSALAVVLLFGPRGCKLGRSVTAPEPGRASGRLGDRTGTYRGSGAELVGGDEWTPSWRLTRSGPAARAIRATEPD